MECVRKIITKFPSTDTVFKDLCILDPGHRFETSAACVTCLHRRFLPSADLDALLMEFREYQSLPNPQLPLYTTLDEFWASFGDLPQPGSEIGEKRFGSLAAFCKTLLVLPHSTADPEHLFSIIGKIDTSQISSLLPSTVQSILSVKINYDQECFQTSELVTPDLLSQARTATVRSLSNSND